jgi:membrane-bound ClpP family serine protease
LMITCGISIACYRFALIPSLASHNQQPVMDEEAQLPGSFGRVVKSLDPTGTVNVRGELWTAYSNKPIQTGDEVVVIQKEGLQLYVEKSKGKRKPLEHGEHEEIQL